MNRLRLTVQPGMLAAVLAASPAAADPATPDVPLRVGTPVATRKAPSDPWSTLWICTAPRTGSSCEHLVGVPVRKEPTRSIRDFRLQTTEDRRPADALARWRWLVGNRDALLWEGRAPTSSGREPVPPVQLKVQHEILVVLSDLTGERAFRRQTLALPDQERSRGARVEDAVAAQHRRASYIEIEEFNGPARTTVAAGPSLVAGFSLVTSAIVVDALIRNPRSDETSATPNAQFWAPGIKIRGRFKMP